MKQYIVTELVNYAAANQKCHMVHDYLSRFNHTLVKGDKPITGLVKAIKERCRMLDRKFPRTRPLLVELYSLAGEHHQITVYSGDPNTMSGQPKAAVIYLALLEGEIDMDKLEAGTIDFGTEQTADNNNSRKEEQS